MVTLFYACQSEKNTGSGANGAETKGDSQAKEHPTTQPQKDHPVKADVTLQQQMMEYYCIFYNMVKPETFNLPEKNAHGLMMLAFYGRHHIDNPDFFLEHFKEHMKPYVEEKSRLRDFEEQAKAWFTSRELEYRLNINQYINYGLHITSAQTSDEENTEDVILVDKPTLQNEEAEPMDEEIKEQLEAQEQIKSEFLELVHGTYTLKGDTKNQTTGFTFEEEAYTFTVENPSFVYEEKGTIQSVEKRTDYVIDLLFTFALTDKTTYDEETGQGSRTLTINTTSENPMVVRDQYITGSQRFDADQAFVGVLLPAENEDN